MGQWIRDYVIKQCICEMVQQRAMSLVNKNKCRNLMRQRRNALTCISKQSLLQEDLTNL